MFTTGLVQSPNIEILPGDGTIGALGERLGALEILLRLGGLGLLAGHLGPRQGNLRVGLLQMRLRLRDLRQRLLPSHFEIPRVEPGDHPAGRDRLILLHEHFRHRSGEARADLVHVRSDVGVVRPDPGADVVQPPVAGPGGGGRDGGGEERDGEAAGAWSVERGA